MSKKILFLLFMVLPNVLFAYDCSQYKYNPDIDIKFKTDDVNVQKSNDDLIGKLGYTEPKISYGAISHTVIIPVHGGYCVSLRGVDIEITEKFDVVIDKKLKEKSCAYDIVYKHEQDHVNVYKDVIKNNIDNIKQSITEGVKNIKPVFTENEKNIPDFTQQINESDFVKKIKSDILQKITNENIKIDERGDSFHIWECEDFYKEMKNKNIVID